MATIPSTWEHCTLVDVAKIISGGTPKSSVKENFCETGGIAWLTPADLSGYEAKTISKGKRNLTDVGYKSCSAKKMPKGSVLYSSRAPIGYVVIAENEISTNQGFKSFVPDVGIDSDYLYYYLKSIKHIAEAKATGTTFKELSGTATKALPFIAPPAKEQKRIVEKLDSLLAQVDTIQQRLNNLPNIIKRFRQSVLAAAVSGKLTEQWRDKSNAKSWQDVTFDDLVLESGNGLSKRKGSEGAETTILRLADFKNAVRVNGKERKILLTEKEVKKYQLIENDLLVIRVNGSIELAGKFILYNQCSDVEGFCDHFIRFRVNQEKSLPKFLTFITNEGLGRRYLVDSLSTSAGQNTINQKSIKALKIKLPSIAEQTEIVRLVEQYFALADTLEKNLANAKQRVDNLTQSILAKAFKGELVPQDPNDESADKLLERIKAARVEAEKLEKAAKASERKAAKASKASKTKK